MSGTHKRGGRSNEGPFGDAASYTSFDTAAAVVYLVAMFLSPFLFLSTASFPFFATKHILIIVGLITAVGLWAIGRFKEGAVNLPKNPLVWVLGGLVLIYLIGALFVDASSIALIGDGFADDSFATFLVLASGLMLVPLVMARARWVLLGYLALFFSATVLAALLVLQLTSGVDWVTLSGPATTPIGSWRDVGIFYSLTATTTMVTLMLVDLRAWLSGLLYILLFGSLAFVMLSGLVAAWWVLAVIGVISLLYIFGPLSKSNTYGFFHHTVIPVGIVVICSLVGIFTGGGYGLGISQSADLQRSPAELPVTADMSLMQETLKSSPLLGSGPNRFEIAYSNHTPTDIYTTSQWATDFQFGSSYLFSVPTTLGVVGSLGWGLFLLLLIAVGVRALAIMRSRRPFWRYLTLSSFLSSILLVGMLFVYNPNIVLLFFTFAFIGLFLATLYRQGVIRRYNLSFVENPKAGFISIIFLALIAISSVASLYIYANKYAAATNFYQAENALAAGELENASSEISAALEANKYDTYYRFAAQIDLTRLNEVVSDNTADAEVVQSRLVSAIQYARNAIDRDSADYKNWMTLGRIYAALVPQGVSGAYEQANTAYEQAEKRNPNNPQVILARAQLELTAENLSDAKQLAKRAQSIKPDYTEAAFLLTRVQVQEGNIQAARSSAQSATEIAPNDPTLFFQLGILEYEGGNYSRAVDALEEAVELAPSYANAKYYLGLSHARLGNTDTALKLFREIAETNPGNERVQRIIQNIASGKSLFSGISSSNEAEGDLPVGNQ